jgi:hypothetical protein
LRVALLLLLLLLWRRRRLLRLLLLLLVVQGLHKAQNLLRQQFVLRLELLRRRPVLAF